MNKGSNRLKIALRNAANAIGNLKESTPLRDFFMRINFRKGRVSDISASARKLAVILWNIVTKCTKYVNPEGYLYLDEKRKLGLVNRIKKQIVKFELTNKELGFVSSWLSMITKRLVTIAKKAHFEMNDIIFWLGVLLLNLLLFIIIFTTLSFTKRWTRLSNLTSLPSLLKIMSLTIFVYITFITTCFLSFDTNKVKRENNKVIVVLGNPAFKNGQPSSILKSRLDKALNIEKQLKKPIIVVTGSAVYNNFIEAEVMKKYLVLNGVDSQRIIVENKAKNTYQNAQYSSKILDSLGLKNPIIVTSHFHQKRTKKIFVYFISNFTVETNFPNFYLFLRQFPIYVWEFYMTMKIEAKHN